jgi:hypothetical protein
MHKELEPHLVCQQSITGIGKPLARASGRVPREVRNLTDDRQEGEAVIGRKPRKHLVPINQRPSNGGRWGLSGRSVREKFHVGVNTVGENQHKTINQARQSFGSVVSTVATHLAIVGRGFGSVPSVVIFKVAMHNPSFKRDA